MLELWCVEQKSFFVKVNQYLWICILYEDSRIRGFLCQITLAIYELYKRKIVLSSYICIVLTKCRCDMNEQYPPVLKNIRRTARAVF